MPRQSEAKKDVVVCEKRWGADKRANEPSDVRMGKPAGREVGILL
jgi:hypothetical protein